MHKLIILTQTTQTACTGHMKFLHLLEMINLHTHDTLHALYFHVTGTATVQVTPLRILASSPYSKCTSCRHQGHAGGKTLLQQNPSDLN